MNTNILIKLEQLLGTSKKSSSDERLFHCPFCHHKNPKLSVNLGNRFGFWKCWVCDAKGKKLYSLLHKIGIPISEIKEILGTTESISKKDIEGLEQEILRLPSEYVPMWAPEKRTYEYYNAVAFLKRRGITKTDIYRYQIGYCESGPYANRIIIPSYDEQFNLNYFVSRAYFDSPLKYKNPATSRNIVIFEHLINWHMPVVLVEGMFDAISVRRNSIPLLGKQISNRLKEKLILNKPPVVYVMLDNDAEREAKNIVYSLTNEGINAKLVSMLDKDAGELGFSKSWEIIDNASNLTFTQYIHSKI